MKNIKMKVDKDILTITIDLKKRFGKSKSEKSEVIASSLGNGPVDGAEGVMIGLNVYKKLAKKGEE